MKRKWLYIFDYQAFDFKALDNALYSEEEKYCFKQYYGNKHNTLEQIKNIDYRSLKKDDIIYVRFKNMPDNISRIVLKLIVIKVQDENGNYLYEKDKKGYYHRYCLLGGRGKIKWIYNEDDYKFSTSNLQKTYSITTNYKCEITDNEKLLLDLSENEYPYTELKNKMIKLKTCTFIKENSKRNHETFITASGLPYREGHHFVCQSVYKNCKDEKLKEELSKLIYNKVNNILICPICHRQIHNGEPKEILKMINFLLENVVELKENTEKICKLLNKSIEELIKELYNVDYTSK